ncbi:vomeronasal type-2 receptor 26-like [Rana temporaria]|uniref:vomeronasal type-2 receptor 26-like n=1 Tax=Rana temporaria TaxID=8407 RepID=UPI001AACCE8A|nr:vomeronasal type-2 receptor 26-like [Rana temporaria]
MTLRGHFNRPPVSHWRLNESLLDDPIIVIEIEKALKEYFLINDTDGISAETLWAAHKASIRGKIIQIATKLKKEKALKVEKLEREFASLSKQHKKDPLKVQIAQLDNARLALNLALTVKVERSIRWSAWERDLQDSWDLEDWHRAGTRAYKGIVNVALIEANLTVMMRWAYRREYRHLLAFIFAIDEINRSPDFLPNITLGYHMYDSCGHVNKAIKDVLQILSGHTKEAPNYSCMERGALAGFIGDLHSDTTLQMAQLLNLYGYTQVPRGQCSEECLPGFRKSVREGYHPCCYNCAPCSEGEISNQPDSELCKKCPDNEWPNKAKTICSDKGNEYLSYEEDILVLFFSITSVIFATTSLLILGLFVWFRSTPIVRANNRNLSFILLLSLILSFLSVFMFLGRPVDITCMLQQVTFGVPFTISASSILAKTIMVFIAFKATRPGSSCRKWVGVKLPNTVMLFCSSIQVMNCILWLSISPPFQEYDMDSYPGKIIIQCNEGSVIGFYSMLGYMGFLAAVSFLLAFMVRTLPDSFNEAKYITFSMLVFCSVWIAMIPAYLSTRGKYMAAVEIFAILTSSSGILLCMFSPKLYILLLKPELNTRGTMLGKRMV